ncbi:NUDIX domain-containing protein [Subtercola boreus]|uniref:ADP-ribose pyrophosphatase n=1 Tax=Subtercola boreus TaxID=120213 RepID=A0A3E0WDJ9_9MICO|nr:NUDIX hydrolase [Subtercola boreus]RFA20997.1 ADP-ribose pyrophosphatase [Subtercola boreus]RFA21381.1 ADP-ribose pyrophosphatase [Subtercola boreus]RFA27352.1 ADP-ribose pyrophosphatase [Subtercola boreus]
MTDSTPSPLSDETATPEITGSEVVFDGKIWDVRRETFVYNGADVVREFVDHTGAVAIVALDENDRMLLIKQYRHPIRTREWEIPAGLLDVSGEDWLVGAKRELAEEADLEADTWNVLTDYATTPGGNNELIRIYLARDVRSTATPFEREDEEADIELRWVDLDEVVDAVLRRELQNPNLVIASLALAASRSRGWGSLGAPDAPWPEYTRLHPAAS